MSLDYTRARPLLHNCDLRKLFVEELGWEPCRQQLTLAAGDRQFTFAAIAEKRGFTAWQCESADGGLPGHGIRLKLDRQLSETSFEHLVVFVSPDRSCQSWMWVRRESGRPIAVRTHEYWRSQQGDSLLHKLDALYISLEEEEAGITVAEVAGRARAAFDVERVTKTFYREFDTHRKAFVKFIEGIDTLADREWYASVMLNRLMFVYFIQRKGFLDGDSQYMRHRLKRCQEQQGRDRFYSFYRYFLLRLFHEGFGRRRKDRAPDLERLLGNIPYLNGGIFDVHELEKPEWYGKEIQIPDKAFERIFDYFDQWQWHLDERPLRADNEINPDVLGYIFEKYINQKQMGAYYTKEDITDYIGKNTVLPFLLDAARAKCRVAFENPNGPTVWDHLRERPDRYIYAPVRHGVDLPLPLEIERGVDTSQPNLIQRRAEWNKPAPAEYALPTEIWREVVARRQRCTELRRKLSAGEVHDANDLITLNLDIRQFVQDVIAQCEGPDLLRAIWHALTKVTVLDPTCGSGAFLFAVLNLLEPLYEACLDRMEAFLSDLERSGEKHRPEKFADFRAVLARVGAHPNRRYFIFKSIILQNLYGVDIMEEAVEICKLRLFLKLAAQVDPKPQEDNLGIEPLPDIDFNIRAGNTLVGYSTYAEVEQAVTSTLDFDNAMQKISVRAADLQQYFDAFRQRQVDGDGSVPAAHKQELQKRLAALRDELDRYLATDYGVNVRDKSAYAKWLASHKPFHWFVEFYGILNSGGFDVIIGNPPYVEYKDVCRSYRVRNLTTEECSNLFAFVLERSTTLSSPSGDVGMIVPLSAFSTDRMIPLIAHLRASSGRLRVANFSWRPGKLFDGVNLQLSILLQRVGRRLEKVETTRYLMWDSETRPELFSKLEFAIALDNRLPGSIPKLGADEAVSILAKLRLRRTEIGSCFTRSSANRVFYRRGGLYWKVFVDFETGSSEEKIIHLLPEIEKHAIIAVLSSDLWWWYFTITSDCRHLGNRDIGTFPFDLSDLSAANRELLCGLGREYVKDLKRNAENAIRVYKGKKAVECLSFRVNQSKLILDQIDTVLARHYGFTEEELDFIINYDIKYRMGRDAGEEE